MSTVVNITNARLSFPVLIEPTAMEEGAVKKYRADLIMPPNHPGFADFMRAAQEVAVNKWAAKAHPILTMINNDKRLRCYGNGNDRVDAKTFTPYLGYEGNVYVTGSSVDPIELFDAQGNRVPESNQMLYKAEARRLYGGCYVNAALQVWPWDNTKGRGISCTLIALQFAADGEPFGEMKPDVSTMFKPVAGAAPLPDWV